MKSQSNQPVNRRGFLQLTGLGATALISSSLVKLLSACSPGSAGINSVSQPTPASPDIEMAITAAPSEISILPGQPTKVWRYQAELIRGADSSLQLIPDSYLGPVIRASRGQNMRIHFKNELPEESIIHWHGLHVPESADGHPRLAVQPGDTYTYDFTVLDRAGTYWFHPHPHGRTGPQVYAGLTGLFLVSDAEELSLKLPSGEFDVPLVIQDRLFDGDNQLLYGGTMMDQMNGFLGNRLLVNGQEQYILPAATCAYRLRLINGSNSRIYKLAWEDSSPLTVIGTDGGLLERPIQKQYITLAPAQRLDIWADFSGREIGDSLRLMNLPASVPGGSAFPVLEIRVDRNDSAADLPDHLSDLQHYDPADAANHGSPREFLLAAGMGMRWTINGRSFEMTDVARDEVVRLGDLETWQFTNQAGRGMGGMSGGGMMGTLPHPMHVHGLQFQVLQREVASSGQRAWETIADGLVDEGWHDTVLVMPDERVTILLKFEDFTGLYLYHCHNLEHEDMGMMRNFRIV